MAFPSRPSRITVLVYFDRISLFYTLAPLLLARDVVRLLDFTQSVDYCFHRDRNRALLILRYFEGLKLHDGEVDLRLMARLREKYDRIVFFDDADGSGCTRFEVMPFVDLYLKKQLFRDLSVYGRPLYGRELHSDYYHHRFGVTDSTYHRRRPLDPCQEPKLRLAWNLGVGSFPLQKYSQRLGVAMARCGGERLAFRLHRHPLRYTASNRQLHDVHARFSSSIPRPSVFFQRHLLLQRVVGHPSFLTGLVPPKQYREEIRNAKITLSPFGWGEVCFRDFEAVLNDSLLLKPDMGHLTTWPNIYRPLETYVPISWDGDDVAQRAEHFLQDSRARRQIVANAKDALNDALRQIEEKGRTAAESILCGPPATDWRNRSENDSQVAARAA
jgi:hypothetical protein